ncbi:MAG: hypothetical protein J6I41_04375 [Bacteroidales bacterium]|nr:hypothetical protein [Bacteroidales bacterium]
MAKITLLGLALLMLVAACGGHQRRADAAQPEVVASFLLGAGAELRLLSDGNLSQLELYYGGDLQELVGTANTDYVRSDSGQITLDTITDTALAPAYVVRTYDRSSTYGAEVWYLLSPYRRDDPDGPWNIVKVPDEKPTLQSVEQYIR